MLKNITIRYIKFVNNIIFLVISKNYNIIYIYIYKINLLIYYQKILYNLYLKKYKCRNYKYLSSQCISKYNMFIIYFLLLLTFYFNLLY